MTTATRGRARELGLTKPVTFELDPALNEAINQCAKRDRRSKTTVVAMALEKYLTEQGLWPPLDGDVD